MNDQTADRRVRRTQRALNEALIALILEKPYEEITVGDISERADVGRTTFYAHFDNKEDLFMSSWQTLLDHVVQLIRWSNAGSAGFLPVRFMFNHAREFRPFFLALVESEKASVIFEAGIPYMTGRLENELSNRLDPGFTLPVPVPLLAHHLASGFLNLLRWWLLRGMPYSPERMDEICHALCVPDWLGKSVLKG